MSALKRKEPDAVALFRKLKLEISRYAPLAQLAEALASGARGFRFESEEGYVDNVKQVIVIRKDLKMRRGKEIAQGSHASIAWLTNRLGLNRHYDDTKGGCYVEAELSQAEWEWVQGNFRKICCIVNSEQELLDLCDAAKEAGLVYELIEDSGLTEFHGEPTFTAAAFGPDFDEKLDPVTGHLVLY